MKGEIFDETTAENVLAFSGKNRQQFVSYTNDGTEDEGNSSKPKYEQVTKQDAPMEFFFSPGMDEGSVMKLQACRGIKNSKQKIRNGIFFKQNVQFPGVLRVR